MSEVCILHAGDSEGFARLVAAQLAADGYSVVRRDASSPKAAERRLADAVIVIWSEAMLAASSMIDSARRALARRILVPVAVGDVRPPASFAHLLPIDLKDWCGDVQDPRWQFVREEVDLARRRGELSRDPAFDASAPRRRKKMPLRAAVPMAAAGALGAIVALTAVLMNAQMRAAPERIVLAEATTKPRPAASKRLVVAAPRSAAPAELAEVPAPPIIGQLSVPAEPAQVNTQAQNLEDPAPPAAGPAEEDMPIDAAKLPRPVADSFAGSVFRDCADCPDMAEVRVDGAAFAMARREIRFSDWDACFKEGGCAAAPDDEGWGRDSRPVVNVSYADAERYADWLSRKTGRKYRVPSAEEWRAAAADAPVGANLAGALDPAKGGLLMTVPAGSFAPSVLGLYDMLGNVAEWTSACENEGCMSRLVFGGAYDTGKDDAGSPRPAAATRGYASVGFRVVRDLQ